MDVTASLAAEVGPQSLYELVADLGRYPEWLDIVPRAEPADADPDDPGPAWSVDLRAQVGPLRRSKRLRMVRTRAESPERAVFERRELDGRSHSDWVLEARIVAGGLSVDADTGSLDGTVAEDVGAGASADTSAARSGAGTTLVMRLHYGGTLWVPMLDRLLADEIERSRGRLLAVLGAQS